MNAAQIKAFQSKWWPNAARANGWPVGDRLMRLNVCMWCLSLKSPSQIDLIEAIKSDRIPPRYIESIKDVVDEDEITHLKKCLEMLGDNLKATEEVGNPQIDKARRIRHQIITEIVPCLELYIEDVHAYMTDIMADKNRWWKIDRPARSIRLTDLSIEKIKLRDGRMLPSPLEQMQYTLAARLNDKRKAAGHSIHDMKIAAHVTCTCAPCCRRRTAMREPESILTPF